MKPEALITRVEYWRERLCPEWMVTVTDKDPGEVDGPDQRSWVACMDSDLTIANGAFAYKPELLDLTKNEIDRIIVHELLHILLDRVLDHDRIVEPYLGAVSIETYREARRPDMEEFVNRLAHVIVDGRARTGTKRIGKPRVGFYETERAA